MAKDGRTATQPYRVRTGDTWFWADPTMAREEIEPGDTVVLYPAEGDAVIAVLQHQAEDAALVFSSLSGEHFAIKARDIAAMHLAAPDEEG